jgi:aspartate/methionine/tyrosine aminotransferase
MLHRSIRDVPNMGVIHVVAEAMKLGFYNGHPQWCNLGQGQPEVGDMDGAPPRLTQVELAPGDHAYGPVAGIEALRQAVADHYNRLYRRGKAQQYTKDNVAIAAGGRLMLSRVLATLHGVNLGYQTPDYTAYEDLIDRERSRVTPVLLPTDERAGFHLTAERFERSVREQGLGAFVVSNPCNPTGHVIAGEELQAYVDAARRTDCLLILDEFYSHFTYADDGSPAPAPVSAAAHIERVDEDPVLLIDGLTKCYRYPGWRVAWVVGPREIVAAIGRSGSAIDGGPSVAMQRAAIQVLEPARADQETTALRQVFARKRQLMIDVLSNLGVRLTSGRGTFYLWGSIENLPAPFNDAEHLFRAALERRVMLVPGRYFDVNPGRQRAGVSPLAPWMRFSFGPPEPNLRLGLSRLTELIRHGG